MKSIYIIKDSKGNGFSVIKTDCFNDNETLKEEISYKEALNIINTYKKLGYKYLGIKYEDDLR